MTQLVQAPPDSRCGRCGGNMLPGDDGPQCLLCSRGLIAPRPPLPSEQPRGGRPGRRAHNLEELCEVILRVLERDGSISRSNLRTKYLGAGLRSTDLDDARSLLEDDGAIMVEHETVQGTQRRQMWRLADGSGRLYDSSET